MNEVIKCMLNHRSNRSFELGYKLTDEEVKNILSSLKQAPSWMNGQHFSVIAIDDQKLKEQLHSLSPRNEHIKTSAIFLLFLIDLNKQKVASELCNKDFNIQNEATLLTATMDTSLAMQNASLAAESLGYGTVFCGALRYVAEDIIKLLDLPKYSYPLCGLSIGKLDEKLTTERIKPRFEKNVNIGFNKYPEVTKEDVENYDEVMEKFAEARETKKWSQKFADFYENEDEKTTITLKQQGFLK